ncbi:serine acetyltransferase [Pseudoalteromonas sp. SG43-6]|uniref:serine O-acetyltransferase n=1 Tax=Pseudoalteromonas sp. SG43-6 TaxID=2760967 RepID=UPI0016004952|nr:serine acetyltransferase [Pseudoalteromonas sp. SG43-6]MBB1436757.1 serine acetyltransferase [Pseudoalteromonas sp. SG43-6]
MNPIIIQRLSFKLYKYKVPIIPKLLSLFIRLIFNCYLSEKSNFPKDLILGYGGLSIVIHERAMIGFDCHIDQCVTIGGTSKVYGVPIIGESVYIGAGAKVLGNITIGNNVVIGANAVVLCDLPDNCVAVGVPAKVIKHGIEKSDYV